MCVLYLGHLLCVHYPYTLYLLCIGSSQRHDRNVFTEESVALASGHFLFNPKYKRWYLFLCQHSKWKRKCWVSSLCYFLLKTALLFIPLPEIELMLILLSRYEGTLNLSNKKFGSHYWWTLTAIYSRTFF